MPAVAKVAATPPESRIPRDDATPLNTIAAAGAVLWRTIVAAAGAVLWRTVVASAVVTGSTPIGALNARG